MTTSTTARDRRVQEIADGAVCRAQIGLGAIHRRLEDGAHEVSVFDRAAGRQIVGVGDSLAVAIQQVRTQQQEALL